MPRRPRVTLPPSVRVPARDVGGALGPASEGGARPSAGAALRSAKARAKTIITRIQKRLRSADAEYYAVGKELVALNRPAVFAAFGVTSFDAFLDAEVMPAATAHRYMAVASEYSEVMALRLGVNKAFHLIQYAKASGTRLRAHQLAERDSAIGTPRRRVSTLSATDVANIVRSMKLGAARAALPKPTRTETQVARQAARQVEALLGVDARVRVDKKRDLVRLELRLSSLLE